MFANHVFGKTLVCTAFKQILNLKTGKTTTQSQNSHVISSGYLSKEIMHKNLASSLTKKIQMYTITKTPDNSKCWQGCGGSRVFTLPLWDYKTVKPFHKQYSHS